VIYLIFTFLGFILQIIILTFLKQYITDYETAAIIFITINFIFFTLDIYKYKFKIRNIIFSAYVIRLAAMFWDIYARHIFVFPNSGIDTEGFLSSGLRVYNNMSLLLQPVARGIYSKTIGVFFYIIMPHRLIGQYINVLLGVSIIIIFYKILVMLKINDKTIKYSILIIAFFPNAIINSAILLRENIIVFFIILSFYYFIKWYKTALNKYVIFSLLALLAASAYHAGVIGLAAGYVFMYLFYNHKKNKFVFSKNTVLLFILILIISTNVYIYYNDVFLAKFGNLENIQDLYEVASSRRGGSTYLTSLKINNWGQLILYSPIYMFYFLVSPLPWTWRGFGDILAFIIDGVFYGYFLFYSLYYSRKFKIKGSIFTGTVIAILATVFIFAVGVQNAGTAMRHRHKIIPIIIILYSIIQDYKYKSKIDNL
jgi:hypothetical protein